MTARMDTTLPATWSISTLGAVASGFLSGGTPSTKNEMFWKGSVPWITSKWLNARLYLDSGEKFISDDAVRQSATTVVPRNSLIFATRVGVGKVAVNRLDLAISQDLAGVLIDANCYDIGFLAYQLRSERIQNTVSSHKRGATIQGITRDNLKGLEIYLPPLPEQHKIAGVLGVVQQAIEHQERLLQLTAELKKTLLHQLFTQGLRGEPQKQTEIGPVPESWNLVSCEDLCEMITVGVVVKPASHYVPKGVPAFRSFNVREDRLAPNDLVYFSETDNSTVLAKSKLRTGDVLVVRTGYPGTSCVVPEEYDGANCIDLVIIRPKAEVIRSGFLSRFFNAPAGKRQAVAAKHGLAQQHLNVGAVKRTRIPVPSLEEQDEIDFALATIQRKIFLITARKKALEDLFRTLLHQLITAQIRVHDLYLPELAALTTG